MAVRTMTSKEAYDAYLAAVEAGQADDNGFVNGIRIEVVRNYSGHEEGIHHGSSCPHASKARAGTDKEFTPECVCSRFHQPAEGYPYEVRVNPITNEYLRGEDGEPLRAERGLDTCRKVGPLYMETSHVGLVLYTGEQNGYDDSDFTVTVWDWETRKPDTFVYASTRGWTYPNSARPDATSEVMAAYTEYGRVRTEQYRQQEAEEARIEADRKAHIPTKWSWVECVAPRARKVKCGQRGLVLWTDEDRVGLSLDGTKNEQDKHVLVFASASNFRAILEGENGWNDRPQWVHTLLASRETFLASQETARQEAAQAATGLPENAWVKVTEGRHQGTEGMAFFVRDSDGLVGIALTNAKDGRRFADKVWAKADQVTRCEENRAAWASRYKVRA